MISGHISYSSNDNAFEMLSLGTFAYDCYTSLILSSNHMAAHVFGELTGMFQQANNAPLA